MFTYNISNTADTKAFSKACALIEKNIIDIKEQKLVNDVDGSQIQIYITTKGCIKVFNDYEVDAVYCDSDIDLSDILK